MLTHPYYIYACACLLQLQWNKLEEEILGIDEGIRGMYAELFPDDAEPDRDAFAKRVTNFLLEQTPPGVELTRTGRQFMCSWLASTTENEEDEENEDVAKLEADF